MRESQEKNWKKEAVRKLFRMRIILMNQKSKKSLRVRRSQSERLSTSDILSKKYMDKTQIALLTLSPRSHNHF